MKSQITDELLRQIEIAAMVLHKPEHYSSFDFEKQLRVSIQTVNGDLQKLRNMDIDIHSSSGKLSVFSALSNETINKLLCTYLSLNQNETINNLSLIRQKFGESLIYYIVETIKAINNRKLINLKYKFGNSEELTKVTLLPLSISRIGKTFYILGLTDDDPEKQRQYLLERIYNFEFPGIDSNIKDLPNITELFKYSWGAFVSSNIKKVELLFTEELGEDLKEKIYIENQKFEKRKDGYLMTLEVGLSYEFISWVMGFGGEVKIIKPKVLINEVLSRAKGILKSNNGK